MGDLKDGDLVFDETGAPVRVVRAWPVRHGRPCYEITFSDGSVITADAEHLWAVDTRATRRAARVNQDVAPQVLTTQDMLPGARVRCGKSEWSEYSVRVAAALRCPDTDLPVPPYTLGAWLGDGSNSGGTITVADADRDILTGIEDDGFRVTVVPSTVQPGKTPLYRIHGLSRKLTEAGVWRHRLVRHQGPGHHTMEGDKHIPVAYQRASEGQRRALLAGLLDTDGYCDKNGRVEYTTTRERLAQDVLHLVSSLGYKACLRPKKVCLAGKDYGTAWIVRFTPADKVFRLPRKAARQHTTVRVTAGHRYITAIRPVPTRPVRCITVNSPNSLYLAGKTCIPTHNTMGAAWNELAETITRYDAAVFGFDITKGSQFLGPMEVALHRLFTEKEQILDFMPRLHRCVKARATFLGDHGFPKWQEGCGLTHLTFWLEECPDIIGALGDDDMFENWMSDIKALRSAGGRWGLSLQRSDFTQMPTLARGQLAKMCFGVSEASDADFGLSAYQKDQDCRPELWTTSEPGACYLDAPTIDQGYKAMKMRTWYWGEDQEAIQRLRGHAAEWPASARPLDPVTAEALGMPGAPMVIQPPEDPAITGPADRDVIRMIRPPATTPHDADEREDHMRSARDTQPGTLPDDTADSDYDELPPDDVVTWDRDAPGGQFQFPEEDDEPDQSSRLTPEEARTAFVEALVQMRDSGQEEFTADDIADVVAHLSRSRTWPYQILQELTAAGMIRKVRRSSPTKWRFAKRKAA